MANIESKLTAIRSASGGEDVRDAIIGALRDINNDVPADMSNPKQKEYNMPSGSDLTVSINPPELVSQIIVRQPNSGGKSTTLNDITITENGEYPADDPNYDPNKENRYYDKVTVKVPQLANAVLDLEEEITQNGTYSAPADWGVDGIRTFTVNVSGASGDGPFTVEFYDDNNIATASVIQTQIVSKGGNAIFNPPYPTSPIGPFSGWNPNPVNVTRDMKCYPMFGQIIVDPTEIHDDWTVICANRGVGYPLGSHKILAYGATFTEDEIKTWYPAYTGNSVEVNIYMMMYKVAEGEGLSHSTWVGTPVNINHVPGLFPGNAEDAWAAQNNSWLRGFLNGAFFNHMADIFKNNIVPVTKYSLGTNPRVPVPTSDSIWILGAAEIATWQTKPEGSELYDWIKSSTWSDSSRWCQDLALLDVSSMKYIRDYFNNDRNYAMALAADYLGNKQSYDICLRDYSGGRDIQRWSTRVNELELGYGNFMPTALINIGFCL